MALASPESLLLHSTNLLDFIVQPSLFVVFKKKKKKTKTKKLNPVEMAREA